MRFVLIWRRAGDKDFDNKMACKNLQAAETWDKCAPNTMHAIMLEVPLNS